MPVRFLLDEHISPGVARLLREGGVEAIALREWRQGEYLSQPDEDILRAACLEGLTLVTFDVHSIPPVLRYMAESGIVHAGVVFISTKSIDQDDVSHLVTALERLVSAQGDMSLENQVLFLSRHG